MGGEAYTIRIALLSGNEGELSSRGHKGNHEETELHGFDCC